MPSVRKLTARTILSTVDIISHIGHDKSSLYLFNLNQKMLVACVHITTPMTTTHIVHSASAAAASPFKSLKLGEGGLGAALTAAPPPCRCWPHPAGGPPQQQQTTAPQSAASPAPLPAGLTVPAHTAAAGGTW
jgi:hypothetical protein